MKKTTDKDFNNFWDDLGKLEKKFPDSGLYYKVLQKIESRDVLPMSYVQWTGAMFLIFILLEIWIICPFSVDGQIDSKNWVARTNNMIYHEEE